MYIVIRSFYESLIEYRIVNSSMWINLAFVRIILSRHISKEIRSILSAKTTHFDAAYKTQKDFSLKIKET
jgi:hypothetical protein